ncbi:MAG: hypothetical protein V1775_11615 [Bacteroidota bacterium]
MMKYLRQLFLLILQVAFLLTSCNRPEGTPGAEPEETSVAETKSVSVKIRRYEKALFEIPKDDFSSGLKKIAPEYKIFLGDNYSSPEEMNQLSQFVADRQNQEVYAECLKRFPDMNKLSNGFSDAFTRMAKEVPEIRIPAIYTYVSGFDFGYPVKYTDSALIIALDIYLGSDYKGYGKMGIPVYISSRFTPAHILPDCMKEMALPLIRNKKNPVLLDAMIEEGKTLYFTDVMLPETDDNLKIGYTGEQSDWCSLNENNLWEFLIGQELLFSTDARSMSMFMTDGPFTASFSQESPARTGVWLGWQIVRSYMKKNKVSISELMADTDSQKILEKSGYKPRK